MVTSHIARAVLRHCAPLERRQVGAGGMTPHLSDSALISGVHIQLFKRKHRFPGRAGESARARFVNSQELQVSDYVRFILRREYCYWGRKNQKKARVMSGHILQGFGGIVVEIGRGVFYAPQ